MNDEQFAVFVRDHRDDIVKRIIELDRFQDADIAVLKGQIVRAINIRMRMPVVPLNEIRELLVGYIAIRFIEDEIEFVF